MSGMACQAPARAGEDKVTVIEAVFPRGKCPIHVFGALERSAAPVILFFTDAFGPRDASFSLAEELAAEGWRVLVPDCFYEFSPYEPIQPKSIFEQGASHDRLMEMFGSITQEKIDEDVAALIAFVDEHLGSDAPLGATGYCMGGRYALSAACASQRVRFAAAIHGSNLAPIDQDGPHRRFAQAKGRFYIGVSAIDPTYDAAEHGRLADALREGDTDHIIETYHGVAHGFVFSDISIHDVAASEKHMRRLKENFREVFGAALFMAAPVAATTAMAADKPLVAPGGLLDPAYPDADVYIGTPERPAVPPGKACEVAARYVELVNAGKYAEVAALYADDATFLEPMRPNLHGREQIDEFYTKRIGAMQPQVIAVAYFGSDTECVVDLALQTKMGDADRWVLVSVDHFIIGPDGKIRSMTAFSRPLRSE